MMTTERRYTLEQAAAKIGFRADDIATLLPDVGIDTAPPGYEENTLSEAEVDRLTRFVERIKQYHNGLSDDGYP
jgi:hypothetical protein